MLAFRRPFRPRSVLAPLLALLFVVACDGSLAPNAALEGRVTLSDGAEPSGVTVSLGGSAVVTGADGAYRFGDLRAGEVRLAFAKPGYRAASATRFLRGGETLSLDPLELIAVGSVAARVALAHGGAADGAAVTLVGTGRSGVTDATGRVRIGSVPVGEVVLRVDLGGYEAAETAITVTRGAETDAGTFALVRSSTARVAVGPNALALAGAVGERPSASVAVTNVGDEVAAVTLEGSDPWLEPGVAGVTLAPGESATVAIAATCDAEASDRGTLEVTAGGPSVAVSVQRDCVLGSSPAATDFALRIEMNGSGFSADAAAIFAAAAARWERIVVDDLDDAVIGASTADCGGGAPDRNGVAVDDVLIDAVIEPIDGPGGVLGAAGPCIVRLGDDAPLPVYGIMRFDSADVADLIARGGFEALVLHEMGHVLGIGTLWERAGLLDYDAGENDCRSASEFRASPTFSGAGAVDAWRALGGSGDVPVEDEHGPGTRCGHWDEETFGDELMTGFLDGGGQPLSDLTVASLRDLGYTVDPTAADAYALPACTPACLRAPGAGLDLAAAEIVLRPRFGVGPDGIQRRLR